MPPENFAWKLDLIRKFYPRPLLLTAVLPTAQTESVGNFPVPGSFNGKNCHKVIDVSDPGGGDIVLFIENQVI